ncbi:MAG: MerR family transcriptional regulator, partial [Acidimicrobiales bacterium]
MDSGGGGPHLSLSELVEQTGVPASTIHYYRRSGLIPEPIHQSASRFIYDRSHVEALTRLRSKGPEDSE